MTANKPGRKIPVHQLMLGLLALVLSLGLSASVAFAGLPANSAAGPPIQGKNQGANSPVVGGGKMSPINLGRPAAPNVVLYDQYNNDGNNAIISTNRPDAPTLSSEAADDFIVPAGQSWTIQSVDFRGHPAAPAQGPVTVRFYTNAGSLPGTVVYTSAALTASGTEPDLMVTLNSPPTLAAGTYWVSVQVTQSGSNWYWGMRSVQSNNPAAWREGGGYGTGCTAWSNRGTCTGTTNLPDQMFRLNGTIGGGATVTGTPPTATQTAIATSTPTTTRTATSGATATCIPGGNVTNALIVYSDVGGPPTSLITDMQAEGITTVNLFDASSGTPTLAQLQAAQLVVVFSNNPYADATALGDVLADYADTGGAVVALNFNWYGSSGLAGRWMTGGYTPYNYNAPTLFSTSNATITDPTHPLMLGVTTLTAFFRLQVTLATGAVSVAAWQDGPSAVAYKVNNGRTGVAINAYLGENPRNWSGQFGRVIANAGRFIRGGGCPTGTVTTATTTRTATSGATATRTATGQATATCVPGGGSGYTITAATATIIAGGTRVDGAGCDDCTTNVTLPFPVTVYGTPATSVDLGSNGDAQFTTGNPKLFFWDGCLPINPTQGGPLQNTLFLYYDDLMTVMTGTNTCPGCGIYTQTLGVAPNRQFVVRWNTTYFNHNGEANFEMVLTENSPVLQVIYGANNNNGAEAVSGIQRDLTQFNQFSCNTPVLTSGTSLVYTPAGGNCPTNTPQVTSTATRTATSVPPTSTSTNTAVPPTSTSTTVASTATSTVTAITTATGTVVGTMTTTMTRTSTSTAVAGTPTATITPCQGRVTICHRTGNGNSHTITVSCNALPAHLAHGDTIGACPAGTPRPRPNRFSDVNSGDFFYPFVLNLNDDGALGGYNDGTFRPFNQATRGQFVKIAVLAFHIPLYTGTEQHFTDVPATHTFYKHIETARRDNIIGGYLDGTFRPFANVTRGQVAKIAVESARMQDLSTGTPSFTDVPTNHTFYKYIETAYANGILSGYADGTFRPNNDATRGQVAKIVDLATHPNNSDHDE